nr:unnamed protein product [Spirometra erinaceieuropaei]
MQVLKWVTFVFSIVVFLFGLAVVIVGSLATFLLTSTYEQIVQISAAIPISALVIGIIILAVLIIAEVVICVVTLTKKTELGAAVESMVNRSFFEQFKDQTVRSAFRWMEEELSRCLLRGARGASIAESGNMFAKMEPPKSLPGGGFCLGLPDVVYLIMEIRENDWYEASWYYFPVGLCGFILDQKNIFVDMQP